MSANTRRVRDYEGESAIVGAVRADYFAGTGTEAGRLAATVNQPLKLWALWPK